jgi:hypothetical protein
MLLSSGESGGQGQKTRRRCHGTVRRFRNYAIILIRLRLMHRCMPGGGQRRGRASDVTANILIALVRSESHDK